MKEQVLAGLQELFQVYSGQGIRSIYVYGSITGPDFVPDVSDVDSIAIAELSVPLALEEEMKSFLSTRVPQVKNFGIRLLYKEELQHIQAHGSNLTFYIPTEALLLDFPYWKLAAGTALERSSLPTITYEEGLRAMMGVLKQWHWTQVSEVTSREEHYLKVVARILWMIDGLSGKTYPFSYSALANRHDVYAPIAHAILEAKRQHWDVTAFNANRQLFGDFVSHWYEKFGSAEI